MNQKQSLKANALQLRSVEKLNKTFRKLQLRKDILQIRQMFKNEQSEQKTNLSVQKSRIVGSRSFLERSTAQKKGKIFKNSLQRSIQCLKSKYELNPQHQRSTKQKGTQNHRYSLKKYDNISKLQVMVVDSSQQLNKNQMKIKNNTSKLRKIKYCKPLNLKHEQNNLKKRMNQFLDTISQKRQSKTKLLTKQKAGIEGNTNLLKKSQLNKFKKIFEEEKKQIDFSNSIVLISPEAHLLNFTKNKVLVERVTKPEVKNRRVKMLTQSAKQDANDQKATASIGPWLIKDDQFFY